MYLHERLPLAADNSNDIAIMCSGYSVWFLNQSEFANSMKRIIEKRNYAHGPTPTEKRNWLS